MLAIMLISLNFFGMVIITFSPSVSAEVSWENIQTISKTVEVKPGEEYYAYFDGDTKTIVEMAVPSLEAGLTQKAKDALDEVPNWLHDDLAIKFAELGESHVDAGDLSTPVFADMDGDSDLDLSMGSLEGSIYYYENVGTKNIPIFIKDDDMYQYIQDEWSSNYTETSIAIVDLDADSDNDLYLGSLEGTIFYFENIGTAENAVWGPYNMVPGISLVGAKRHPAFVDLDADSDYDLALGSSDGVINFFENQGTPQEPQWVFSYAFNTQEEDDRSVTFADMDGDSDFDMTVGDGDVATLYYYRNIGSPSQEIWAYDNSYYNGVSPEFGSAPALADIDGDLRVDLMVGVDSGTLYLYKNSGSATNADWLIWSSYQVAPGVNYYPKDVMLNYLAENHQNRYADLIIDSGQLYKDEIAFSIAHLPTENLKALSLNQSQILVDNAQLIYEIDSHLDYVEVIEKADYTTTRYKFGEPGSTVYRELPRDIYYWYIVHPKVTNENVFYIHPDDTDPNHPTDPSNGGRFWREYLFYHADSAYPPDNSGAPDDGVDDYPQTKAPPLLKDLLSGITTLWNGTTHFAPAGRAEDYGDNALVRVSNWVGWTLVLNQQEVSDSERPIQPVRIAKHHNGNCGELQDLTVPAARTALIPASGVLLLGEDHVWIEFFESGWHQWDNYWSHGGSVIDNFNNYWGNWGQRGGSGIMKHGGDDDAWEVTDHYIPEEHLNNVTIRIVDNSGNPVDGARVLVISYWLKVDIEGYQVEIPFPCIWNYTDSNGETLFKLATQTIPNGNKNFTFRVISKVGGFESTKIELEHNQDYTFTFPLEGSAPNPVLDTNKLPNPNPPNPEYRIGASYQVVSSYQKPRNLETGNYHPLEIPHARIPDTIANDHGGNHIDSFIADSSEFEYYLKGYNFDSYEFGENVNSYSLGFDLPDTNTWYFVLSNRDSIETTKVVSLTLELFFNVPPYQIKITDPQNGASLNLGGIIPISGIVTNESELVSLELSMDGGSTWTTITQSNGQWTYLWDTSFLDLGYYGIQVQATYISSQNSDSIQIELVDYEAPIVNINSPPDYSKFNIGQNILITGTASDNIQVQELSVSFDEGMTWDDIYSSLSGQSWSYNWKTSGLDPGGYVIKVKASDGYNVGIASGYLELLDLSSPTISILDPVDGEKINSASIVTVSGEAQDNRGISSLLLSWNSGENWVDILSNLNGTLWSYSWNTQDLPLGLYTLTLNASDGTHNSLYSIDVEIIDSEPPLISITNPTENSKINIGATIMIQGTASDNVDLKELKLKTSGGKWTNIRPYLVGDVWSFSWDTSGLSLGFYTISLKASDGNFQETESLRVELVDSDAPELGISEPIFGKEFSLGETITISGWATDNVNIEELEFSIGDDFWVDLISDLEDGNWIYMMDTNGMSQGLHTITVRVSDGINEPVIETVEIRLIDSEEPLLEITEPQLQSTYDLGDRVIIEGKVSDNIGVTSLYISTDDGDTWIDISDDIDSRGRWSYFWDTKEMKSGYHTLLIKTSDGSNEVEEQIVLELKETESPTDGELDFYLVLLLVIILSIVILTIIGIIAIKKRNKRIKFQ
jgi:hypothetical protein